MWHVFDSDAVDKPLRPMANRFGGCFCLGSGPVFWVLLCFLLFASLFPLAKRKSGWGICGSSFLVWLWFLFLLLQSICRLKGPFVLAQCTPAYSHVRTEPLARHRPHSRKKKHFAAIFLDEGRSAGLHLLKDRNCLVFTQGPWCFSVVSLFCFLLGAILIMTHKMSSCMNSHCW